MQMRRRAGDAAELGDADEIGEAAQLHGAMLHPFGLSCRQVMERIKHRHLRDTGAGLSLSRIQSRALEEPPWNSAGITNFIVRSKARATPTRSIRASSRSRRPTVGASTCSGSPRSTSRRAARY